MPRGEQSKYTGKQKVPAPHMDKTKEIKGEPEKEAQRHASATLNKEDDDRRKFSFGRGTHTSHPDMHKGDKSSAKKVTVQPKRSGGHDRHH